MKFVPHFRALTPDQEEAVRHAASRGADIGELAAAYDVSTRTIRRTIEREPLRVVAINVEGYYAVFEVTPNGPIQRTDWRAA